MTVGETTAINVTATKPTELMFVEVRVAGITLSALIDSGSTGSFLNTRVTDKMNIEVDTKNIKIVTGYGNAERATNGSVGLDITMFGARYTQEFGILSEDVSKYEMIIGVDFMKRNGVVLDFENKLMKIDKDDESTLVISFKTNEMGIVVKHENIPVYCKQKMIIKRNELKKIHSH